MSLMIDCQNLVKIYKTKEIEVVALQGLDLAVEEGELMAIIGNSGSGKSVSYTHLYRPPTGKRRRTIERDYRRLTSAYDRGGQ